MNSHKPVHYFEFDCGTIPEEGEQLIFTNVATNVTCERCLAIWYDIENINNIDHLPVRCHYINGKWICPPDCPVEARGLNG